MNVTVYLFGEFNSGYTQYPDDYTIPIFQKFAANSKSVTQIAIHRDDNLMFYGYVRKLQQEKYIGFCVVLNGLYLKRIDDLFSLFENTISNLVNKGMLIHFNEQGDLITSVEKLFLNQEEITLLTEALRAGFSRFESYTTSLPATNYGISKDSFKDFVVNDNIEEIIQSSYTNGYTYIYKSKGFNTLQLNSYKGVLAKSQKEKQELQAKLDTLQKEHEKTLKQKKQFKFVLILCFILFGCTIGIFSLNNNLNLTRNALYNANDTINMLNDSLSYTTKEICNLQSDLNHMRNALYNANTTINMLNDSLYIKDTIIFNLNNEKNRLEEVQTTISSRQPFIIKNTKFDFQSGYLTIDYYGMVNKYVEIQIKAFDDKGRVYENSSYKHIYQGNHSIKIYVNNHLNIANWYHFIILKDHIIIGGSKH